VNGRRAASRLGEVALETSRSYGTPDRQSGTSDSVTPRSDRRRAIVCTRLVTDIRRGPWITVGWTKISVGSAGMSVGWAKVIEVLTPELAGRAEAVWLSANQARLDVLGIPPGPVAERDALVAQRLAIGAFGVVATDRDEVVAVALAMDAIEDDGKGTEPIPGLMHVSTIAVIPERWGQHLGELVMAAVLDEGRRRGYECAQLWTHESNRGAQRLYERTGWTQSGRTMIDERGEPIRHYILDLGDPRLPA
jgi:ribosomal protein S18 acetylase RimI-like enzyme